jgi:hypothetical protein
MDGFPVLILKICTTMGLNGIETLNVYHGISF